MPNKDRIRRLAPGSTIPDAEPRIYTTSDGYRVWRWKVGPRSYVEALEHRIRDGRVATAAHIHHKNHDTIDNRPENLEGLSAREHRHRHAKVDYEAAWRRYQEGYSTPEVGEEFGVHPATLSRRWRDMGYTLRSVGDGQKAVNRRDIDVERVREMHLAGMRSTRIADELGTTREMVFSIVRDLGLRPHPTGRPSLRDA